MEDINLHFTGDFSAIGLAHNLLSALIDNHIYHGNELGFDVRRIAWKRVVDMNDRALRDIVVGLGGSANGYPREDGFDIVVASEVMAIFCLSRSLVDLKQRLGNIVVGYRRDLSAIRARDLNAQGAMTVLLKEALKPNLVQTLENNPAFIHGGPFANIAHGCNSVLATATALKLADYVVTEAGFGADLGAEKFIDIKCRKSGLRPAAVVIVATIRALKYHGGCDLKQINTENLAALEKGIANLERHVNNVRNHYGLPCVVSVNHFTADTAAEHALLAKTMASLDVPLVLARHWAEGGAGAIDVARKVVEIVEQGKSNFRFVYDEKQTLWDKVKAVATKIYGAADISADAKIRAQIDKLQADGYGHYPVCIAKTQYSFSTDAARARRAERAHRQYPRGAARRRRGVHRGGLRRRHDHAGTAESAVGRSDRHRRAGPGRRPVLAPRGRFTINRMGRDAAGLAHAPRTCRRARPVAAQNSAALSFLPSSNRSANTSIWPPCAETNRLWSEIAVTLPMASLDLRKRSAPGACARRTICSFLPLNSVQAAGAGLQPRIRL